MADINVLRALAKRRWPSCLSYLRKYPPNTTWHGWLSPNAIAMLELAGNTVRCMGGYYVLNSTAPMEPVRAELIGTAQAAEGVL